MNIPVLTTGDKSVLQAFTDSDRRLGIVVCAGGVRNAHAAGAYIALRRQRLLRQVAAFAGVSSGIGTTACFMGNGRATDARIFSEDMTDKRMFDIRRRFIGRYPFDVDYVERVFRGYETNRGIRAYDTIAHPAPLYAVLGHAETGEPLLYKPETAEAVWRLSSYGTAVTGFARPLVYEGVPVTDGYFTAEQLPVELLAHQEQLTDILVFASSHYESNPKTSSRLERYVYQTGVARAARPVQQLIRTRHVRFMEVANRVVNLPHLRVLIVWLPEPLPAIGISNQTARQLTQLGYQTMQTLFQQCDY